MPFASRDQIISEGGIASGVRRIEAVAGAAQVEYLRAVDGIVRELSSRFKVKPEAVVERVTAMQVRIPWVVHWSRPLSLLLPSPPFSSASGISSRSVTCSLLSLPSPGIEVPASLSSSRRGSSL